MCKLSFEALLTSYGMLILSFYRLIIIIIIIS